MIKSRRMIWVGHAACMGERRNAYKMLVWKPEGKRPLRRPKCRCNTMLKQILEEQSMSVWIGFIWHRIGTDGGLL
jgi:hypothetical protein